MWLRIPRKRRADSLRRVSLSSDPPAERISSGRTSPCPASSSPELPPASAAPQRCARERARRPGQQRRNRHRRSPGVRGAGRDPSPVRGEPHRTHRCDPGLPAHAARRARPDRARQLERRQGVSAAAGTLLRVEVRPGGSVRFAARGAAQAGHARVSDRARLHRDGHAGQGQGRGQGSRRSPQPAASATATRW